MRPFSSLEQLEGSMIHSQLILPMSVWPLPTGEITFTPGAIPQALQPQHFPGARARLEPLSSSFVHFILKFCILMRDQ